MRVLVLLLGCLIISSCWNEPRPNLSPTVAINTILGEAGTSGFLRAEDPREFHFPDDHGEHLGYRNEWWYLTGNLKTETGRRFAYQITFFSAALNPEALESDSSWQSNKLWMAHAALTDVEGQEHIGLERFSRGNPGLAGARLEPFKVWLENWRIQASEHEDFLWSLIIDDEAFTLELMLNPVKDLVLQGIAGLSQKSPEPGNASYYYSYTRLQTLGALTLDGEDFQLTGESWLDREWSSSALAEDQTGWDWFSLQFEDGQELMYYQLRDAQGLAHASSQGNWTNQQAEQQLVSPQEIQLQEIEYWDSPAGIRYATAWQLSYEGKDWIVRALLQDQLMDLSITYWEGAVDVILAATGEKVGQGYLEMLRE